MARALAILLHCYPATRRRQPSDNQGAKWGVSNFGTLSAFDFQPKNSDLCPKVINEDSKT